MKEHDSVVLTDAVPQHGLVPGDVGVVVHVYREGRTYEVEFITGHGDTIAVVTLSATQIRPLSENDLLHVREVVA